MSAYVNGLIQTVTRTYRPRECYLPISSDAVDFQDPIIAVGMPVHNISPRAASMSSEADLDITLNNTPYETSPVSPSRPGKQSSQCFDDPFRSRVGAPDVPVRVSRYLKGVKRMKWLLALTLSVDLIVQLLGFQQDAHSAAIRGSEFLYGWGTISAWAAGRAISSMLALGYLFISIRSQWLAGPVFTSPGHITYVAWTFVLTSINVFSMPCSRIVYIWSHAHSPPFAPPLFPQEVSTRNALLLLDVFLSIAAFSAAISMRRGPELYCPRPDIQTGFGINVKVTQEGSLADLLASKRDVEVILDQDTDEEPLASIKVLDNTSDSSEPEPNVLDYYGSSLASFFTLGYFYHVGRRAQQVDQLQQEDLPILPQMCRTENFDVPGMPTFVRREADAAAETFGLYDPAVNYTVMSLFQIAWSGMWGLYAGTLMWECIRTILTLSPAFFMYRIISSFQQEDRSDRSYAYLMCFLLLCFRLLECLVSIYVWLRENFTCHVPVRSRTVALVLSKLLHARNARAGEATSQDGAQKPGQNKSTLLTMLGVDNRAIGSLLHYIGLLLDSILAIIVGTIFLYCLLGKAVLVGMILIPVVMPLSVWLSKLIYGADKAVRHARDRRLNAVREFLASIKLIKLNAYEHPLSERIGKLRDIEVGFHRTRLRLGIVFTLLADQIPLASVAIAFLIYSRVQGKPLEPARAFVAAEILVRVRAAAAWLPGLYQWFLQASISANRICDFLNSPDITPNAPSADGSIHLYGATITWPSDIAERSGQQFSLENISLDIPEGQLTIVTGKSGSGKTLLLEAILGEAQILEGTIFAPRSHSAAVPVPEEAMAPAEFEKDKWLLPTVAYCSQTAVISHGTIRSNILYAQPFIEERYWDVMHACCLLSDLDRFQDGDMQEIGERGVTLSGGQQARLALARAVYSRAKTLLLDDVLAAVDVTCARHIVKHCFEAKIMEGRTVVLVSHSTHLLLPAASLLITLGHEGEGITVLDPRKILVGENATQAPDTIASDTGFTGIMSEATVPAAHVSRTASQRPAPRRQLIQEEKRSSGGISSSHYWWLLRSAGPMSYLFVLLALHILDRAVSVWESKILEQWTGHSDDAPGEVTRMYAVANGVRILVNLSMWMTLYGKGTQVGFARVGRVIHAALFDRIKLAPLSFFDTCPTGRIVNRFSSDIWTADSEFSDGLSRTLTAFVEFVLSCAVVAYRKPTLAIYMVSCLGPYLWMASYFAKLRGDAGRLRSLAESPQISVYVTLLDDMSTIRAFGAQRWISLVASRFVDFETQAAVCLTMSLLWYRICTWQLSNLLVVIISVAIVNSDMSATEAGFTLLWSARISITLYSYLNAKQELDKTFVAAERLHDFSTLPPIEDTKTDYPVTPQEWPTEGKIEYKNVSGRYSDNAP